MLYETGQKLGNYRLVRLLGKGGFAEVYLAKHIYLHTEAAIKVLQIQLTASALENFLKEARIIANLEHPNIVRVLEFGIEDSRPFLVMKYAPFGTLRKRYPHGRQLSPATVLPLIQQLTAALHYAHSHKIIHRDVKPENMLLGVDKTLLLSDFGLALEGHNTFSSQPADNAGTMLYMAPEQFRGNPCAASDQYSLGVVVYEWLSGAVPFSGANALTIGLQHAQVPPTPLHERVPALPMALSDVVMRTLQKDPHTRFAQIQDFTLAFEEACSAHAALFMTASSEEHPQLLEEAMVELHSASIVADTRARQRGLLPSSDSAGTRPLNAESFVAQENASNATHPLLTDAKRATAQTLFDFNATAQDTRPAQRIRTQHIESAGGAQSIRLRFLQRVGRKTLFSGICGIVLVLCLGGIWEAQNQRPTFAARQKLAQSATPLPTTTPHTSHTRGTVSPAITPGVTQPTDDPLSVTNTTHSGNKTREDSKATATPTTGIIHATPTALPTALPTREPPVVSGRTPTSTPTPGPQPAASATPPPKSHGALSVSISNLPESVRNGSTVPLQIVTSNGNVDVKLRVIYSSTTQTFRSISQRTDGNGNASLNWNVNIPSDNFIKYSIATLIVTAYDADGTLAVSNPVLVQIL